LKINKIDLFNSTERYSYIYYAIDAAEDSQEVYAGISFDTILAPSITVYRDIDHLVGWYVTAAIGHSFPISGDYSLDVGAQVSYLDADDATSYAERNGDSYSGLHDGIISASMSFPVNMPS